MIAIILGFPAPITASRNSFSVLDRRQLLFFKAVGGRDSLPYRKKCMAQDETLLRKSITAFARSLSDKTLHIRAIMMRRLEIRRSVARAQRY
jgi:hypothetical protein